MKVAVNNIVQYDMNDYIEFTREKNQILNSDGYKEIFHSACPSADMSFVFKNPIFLEFDKNGNSLGINLDEADELTPAIDAPDTTDITRLCILVGQDVKDMLITETCCYMVRNNIITLANANEILKDVNKILQTEYTPLLGLHIYPLMDEYKSEGVADGANFHGNIKHSSVSKERRLEMLAKCFNCVSIDTPDEKMNENTGALLVYDCMHAPLLLKKIILEIGECMLANNPDASDACQLLTGYYKMFTRKTEDRYQPNHAEIVMSTFKDALSQDIVKKLNEANESSMNGILASYCVETFMQARQASAHTQDNTLTKSTYSSMALVG